MNINLRLYRDNGLHAEITIGQTAVTLEGAEVFVLADAIDQLVKMIRKRWKESHRLPEAIPLNGRIHNMREIERLIVTHAMTFDELTIAQIADQLGVSKPGLQKMRHRHGLPVERHPGGGRELKNKGKRLPDLE